MQADEQIRVVRLGEHDAVRIGHISVAVARQKNRPALRFQQRLEPLRPVEREFLFKPAVQNAVRAGVAAAVAGVNHDDAVGAERQRRSAEQRLEIFLQIKLVQKNFAVNELRLEAEIDFDAVPGRLPAADGQNHHAVARTDRISRHRRSVRAGAARRVCVPPPSD